MSHIFVDTGGWVALTHARDHHHEAAVSAFESVRASATQFITTDYVLDETLTWMASRGRKQEAVRFGRWTQTASVVELVHIDRELWVRSWQAFQRYHDKRWSFTDCTSFVVMQERGLQRAFTFDHHFAQAGFIMWPE